MTTLTATDQPNTFDIVPDGTAVIMRDGVSYRAARIHRANVDSGDGPRPVIVVDFIRQTREGRDYLSGRGFWVTLEHLREDQPTRAAELESAWEKATAPAGPSPEAVRSALSRFQQELDANAPAIGRVLSEDLPGEARTAVTTDGGTVHPTRAQALLNAPHRFQIVRSGRFELTSIDYTGLPDGDLKRLGITIVERWSDAIEDYMECRRVP